VPAGSVVAGTCESPGAFTAGLRIEPEADNKYTCGANAADLISVVSAVVVFRVNWYKSALAFR
jgi:hypothetical protein